MGCRKKVRLSDVAELTPGFAFKSTDFGEYSHKAIKITNISREGYSDAFPGVDIDAYPAGKLDKYLIGEGDYYLAMTGSIGKVGRLVRGSAYLNQRVLGLKAKSQIDADYLWFVLNSADFHRHLLTHIDSHSVQANISAESVGSFEFDLPPMNVQLRIGFVLGSFDKKIIANNRINGYLADLADAIFKERCATPEANATLSDIAEVTMGQSPRGSSYNETHDGTVFYQGRGEFGCRFPIQRLYTTEPKRMARKSDVLMSVRAPVGDLNVAYEDCCIGRGLASIHSSYPSFCLYLMRSLRTQLDSYNGEGTVFGSINGKALKALPIGLPDGRAIKDFERLVGPLDAEIRSNETESRRLAALRDSLLPKLMSGEIDVSKVEVPTPLNSHLSAD